MHPHQGISSASHSQKPFVRNREFDTMEYAHKYVESVKAGLATLNVQVECNVVPHVVRSSAPEVYAFNDASSAKEVRLSRVPKLMTSCLL